MIPYAATGALKFHITDVMNMFKAFENVMAGTPIATVSDDNQKIRIVKGYGKKKNGVEQSRTMGYLLKNMSIPGSPDGQRFPTLENGGVYTIRHIAEIPERMR
jgi:hypothetical protein